MACCEGEDQHRVLPKPSSPTNSVSSSLSNFLKFAVEIIDSSEDQMVVKVKLNGDIFEGILDCTERNSRI